MSKAQVGEIEYEDMRLGWDEISEIAGHLFDLRDDGGDGLSWAKSAWEVLSDAGLDRYFLEVDRTVCIIRFVALYALYSEFCVRALDEGSTGGASRGCSGRCPRPLAEAQPHKARGTGIPRGRVWRAAFTREH